MKNIGSFSRGKVLRISAETTSPFMWLMCRSWVPYIVGDEEKVREVILLMDKMRLRGGSEVFTNFLWRFCALTATSSIERLLSYEEDHLKDKFANAKFIARLDELKHDTYDYYYIVEDLPEDWSVADVIVCFANARHVQDNLEKLLPRCSFEGEATFNFDGDFPIVRIPKSKARYIAEHQDAPYVAADARELSRINKGLAELMLSEITFSNDPQMMLVRPVGNVRDLFAVEYPELAEFFSKVRMVKKLDFQDDENEYFYVAVDDSKLDLVDIIRHQVVMSKIPSPEAPSSQPCDCSGCPYLPFLGTGIDPFTVNFAVMAPAVKKRMTAAIELSSAVSAVSMEDDNVIRAAIEDIYGLGALDLYDKYFTDGQKAQIRANVLKRFQDCEIDVWCQVNDYKSRYDMRMFCGKKEMAFKGKDRAMYGPYLLILHGLMSEVYGAENKVNGIFDTQFPFSLTDAPDKSNADYYNRKCVQPDKKTGGDKTYGYYNAKLAVLFGLLYNSFIYGNRVSSVYLICDRLKLKYDTDIETVINTVLKQGDEWYNIQDKSYAALYEDYEKVAFNIDGNPYRARSYESANYALFEHPGGKYREVFPKVDLRSDNTVFNKLIDAIKNALPATCPGKF